MSPIEGQERVRRWIAGRLGPSIHEAWKNTNPETSTFDSFFSDMLQHLTLHPQQALDAVQRVPDSDIRLLTPRQKASMLRLNAHALLRVGDTRASAPLYRRAWRAFKKLELPREMAATGMSWGRCLNLQGKTHRALEVYRQSLESIPKQETVSRARMRVHIALALATTEGLKPCLREMRAARRAFERAGATYDRAVVDFNIGLKYIAFGQPQNAREPLEAALKAVEDDDRKPMLELYALASLAQVDFFEGRASDVLDRFEAVLAELEERSDIEATAGCMQQHARFLSAVGAVPEAERWARRALAHMKRVGNDRNRAQTTGLLARLLLRRGDLDGAQRELKVALDLFERSGATWLADRTRLEIAAVHLERGQVKRALHQLERCEQGLKSDTRRDAQVRWLHLRARCDQLRGHPAPALKRIEEAYRKSRSVPARWERPWMALTASRAALALEDGPRAFRWAKKAVESLEEMDLRLGSRTVRESIAPTREDVTREAMKLVRELGGPSAEERALDFLSRANSVQLVEDLLRGDDLDDALRTSIARARDELYESQEAHSEDSFQLQMQSQLESLDQRLEKAQRSGTALVRTALDARSLSDWSSRLGDRSLVFYDLEHGEPLAWVMRKGGGVDRVTLPDSARTTYRDWTSVRMLLDYLAHLEADAREEALLRARSEVSAAFRSIRRALWDPLELAPGRVVIIPSASILELPLEATLAADGERWTVTRLPHPALLASRPGPGLDPSAAALLLHDGQRGQRGELNEVSKLLRARGLEVSRVRRRKEFAGIDGRIGLLHFASHGAYDRRRWVGNGVRLSDGWLGFEQLRSRNVRDALLFFSSCESALPSRAPCSSMGGWMTAGLAAGAREMVLTLWKIDDEAARLFASHFYAAWTEHRQADLAATHARARMSDEGVHPFRWAPFITVG